MYKQNMYVVHTCYVQALMTDMVWQYLEILECIKLNIVNLAAILL